MCLNRLGSLEIPGAVPGPPGQNGNDGGQGPEGPAGVGWITGQGIPPNNLTTYPNGTLYLDTLLGNIFEYNASTLAWDGPIANIKGPQGPQGSQGNTGPTGGGGIVYRGGTASQQAISSNSQVISLGSFNAQGNQLMGNTNDMIKICCSTRVVTPAFSDTAYPHIIRIKINGINITDDLFTNFVPPSNSPIAVKSFYSNVEAKIIRTSIAPFQPLVHVTYTTSNDTGFFQYTAISNIDFSISSTISFEIESASTGTYAPTRVTSTNWIERLFFAV
jgi:hypothetical protein